MAFYSGGHGSQTVEPWIIQYQDYNILWKELGINYIEAKNMDIEWIKNMLAVYHGKNKAEAMNLEKTMKN